MQNCLGRILNIISGFHVIVEKKYILATCQENDL